MRLRYPNEEGTVSDQETATAPEAAAPAPEAATAPEAPKPEATPAPKPETDWEKAYKGLQTNLNRVQQTNAELRQRIDQMAGHLNSTAGGVDKLLRAQLGDEGYQQEVAARKADTERQQALQAAQAAQEYVPQSINVIAANLRAVGVAEKDIESVFTSAANTASVGEWAETVKVGAAAAIAKAKSDLEARVAEQVKAKSKDEIQAEAEALAERTVRAKGIDKVDLGRGQSRTPERSFIERIRGIDRNTPEGEAEFQKIKKEADRGTLRP